jgi:plastocyanin
MVMKKNLLLIAAIFFMAISSFATTHTITVADFSFTPSTMTVTLGDTIKWVWTGPSNHTTTSTSVPGGAASWSQNLNASSTSFTYVPAVVGTYNYHCNIHPSLMSGTITVVSSANTPNTVAPQEVLYPNPASSIVQLRFPDAGTSAVAVYDIAGRQLMYNQFQATEADMNVSSLPAGKYIVYIAHGDGYYRHELLIVR